MSPTRNHQQQQALHSSGLLLALCVGCRAAPQPVTVGSSAPPSERAPREEREPLVENDASAADALAAEPVAQDEPVASDAPAARREPATEDRSVADSEPLVPSTSEVGAWYVEGDEAPDEALCVIFCDNGRLFLADSKCTATHRGDFDHWVRYERHEGIVTTDLEKIPRFTFEVSGQQSVLIASGFELTLTRVALDSPVCTDPERSRMGS